MVSEEGRRRCYRADSDNFLLNFQILLLLGTRRPRQRNGEGKRCRSKDWVHTSDQQTICYFLDIFVVFSVNK